MNIKSFDEFTLNENVSSSFVKKGEKRKVKFMSFVGQPEYMVEAVTDSAFSDYAQAEVFSFLHGGDMMLIAKCVDNNWICE